MNGTCPLINHNESTADRVIRIIAGIVILAIGATLQAGVVQTVLHVVGVVALVTGMVGSCGIYSILGISTKKPKKQ